MKLLSLIDKVLAGQTVYSKKADWYISSKNGRLMASSFPKGEGRIYPSEYPNSSFGMEQNDWEVYVPPPPKVFLKDLKVGDRFTFKGANGTKFRVVKYDLKDTLAIINESNDKLHEFEQNKNSEVERLS